MHEYGIAREIARLVNEKAAGRPVAAIALRVGALSGISSDSVSMYLELVFKETVKTVPRIITEEIPTLLRCSCGNTYSAKKIFDPCPHCAGFERTILEGDQCTLESIEVEDE